VMNVKMPLPVRFMACLHSYKVDDILPQKTAKDQGL
jgi:hypothetical protein